MELKDVKKSMDKKLYSNLSSRFSAFRPSQEKAIKAGLLDRKNMLICTPTASGKTLIAEIAALQSIYSGKGKAIYVVPLKALASEKYEEFSERYKDIKVAVSIGDIDSSDSYLERYDLVICTSEKLDSLIRHRTAWLRQVSCIIIDEIHLMNDPSRGPTLEITLTLLKKLLPKAQVIALSATIGNPRELASWLDAVLVEDDWRPIELRKGIYIDGTIEFY